MRQPLLCCPAAAAPATHAPTPAAQRRARGCGATLRAQRHTAGDAAVGRLRASGSWIATRRTSAAPQQQLAPAVLPRGRRGQRGGCVAQPRLHGGRRRQSSALRRAHERLQRCRLRRRGGREPSPASGDGRALRRDARPRCARATHAAREAVAAWQTGRAFCSSLARRVHSVSQKPLAERLRKMKSDVGSATGSAQPKRASQAALTRACIAWLHALRAPLDMPPYVTSVPPGASARATSAAAAPPTQFRPAAQRRVSQQTCSGNIARHVCSQPNAPSLAGGSERSAAAASGLRRASSGRSTSVAPSARSSAAAASKSGLRLAARVSGGISARAHIERCCIMRPAARLSRTMLTVRTPRAAASWMTARPTPLPAPFCTTVSPAQHGNMSACMTRCALGRARACLQRREVVQQPQRGVRVDGQRGGQRERQVARHSPQRRRSRHARRPPRAPPAAAGRQHPVLRARAIRGA